MQFLEKEQLSEVSKSKTPKDPELLPFPEEILKTKLLELKERDSSCALLELKERDSSYARFESTRRLRSSVKPANQTEKEESNGRWPKFEIQLSRNEIGDDFLAMGAKLYSRSKKRAKVVQKHVEVRFLPLFFVSILSFWP
ncbi:hypothetical protein AMTR_s00079p00159880 [Amborella trichopoda]|uniref:Uncharacterized protein n=1 Tax=Amborella trichopoda TaxID=13333 RepID=W1PAG2_AMBTC|nr:hypothetical protein AMTR_s00079p00159880 [Amborella trichopoda]